MFQPAAATSAPSIFPERTTDAAPRLSPALLVQRLVKLYLACRRNRCTGPPSSIWACPPAPPNSRPVLRTCHPWPAHPALFSQRSAVSPTSADGVPTSRPNFPIRGIAKVQHALLNATAATSTRHQCRHRSSHLFDSCPVPPSVLCARALSLLRSYSTEPPSPTAGLKSARGLKKPSQTDQRPTDQDLAARPLDQWSACWVPEARLHTLVAGISEPAEQRRSCSSRRRQAASSCPTYLPLCQAAHKEEDLFISLTSS